MSSASLQLQAHSTLSNEMCSTFYLIHLILVLSSITIKYLRCDWVEIPQQSNRRTYYTFGPPRYSFQKQQSAAITEIDDIRPPIQSADAATTVIPSTTPTDDELIVADNKRNDYLHYEEDDQEEEEESNVQIEETQPEYYEDELNETIKKEEAPINNEENVSYSGFMPLLKSIQQNLIAKVRKSLNSKLELLKSLRDNLLINIDERMTSIFKSPLDTLPESRGYHDQEMDFPSNEGALMTIGFLTFAVFLIKLVIKLIQALKNKQQNGMIPTAMGGTATTYYGRRKRDLINDNHDYYYNSNKILQLIEEYQFN